MFASEFLDLCSSTIYWHQKTTDDRYGKAAYAAAVGNPGHQIMKKSRVPSRGAEGQVSDVVSNSYCIVLAVLPNVGMDDLISIDDPGTTSTATVVASEIHYDETGPQYTKIYLGAFTS